MQDLKIAIIQTHLFWEDIDKNLTHLSQHLDKLHVDTDLILLPEMFSTGFSMRPEYFAETSLVKSLPWLQTKAAEHQAMIAGSIMIMEGGQYFNRLYYVAPTGQFGYYDKGYLFSMGKEDEHYAPGSKKLTVEYKGWKIKPFICYDLRFPEWCRNTDDYDLLVFHANWPERRIAHWDALLKARAIENVSYVAAVNRIGTDGNGINHNGSSQAIAPDGENLFCNKEGEGIHYVMVSKKILEETRIRYPFLKDRK